MIMECTVHGMILSCSSPPVYGQRLTWLKDFGPLICSVAIVIWSGLSYWLARRVSFITTEQKDINKNVYKLNFFKERFAVWNEFQQFYGTIHDIRKYYINKNINNFKGNVNIKCENFEKLIPVLDKILVLFDLDLDEITSKKINLMKNLCKNFSSSDKDYIRTYSTELLNMDFFADVSSFIKKNIVFPNIT